MSCDPCVFCQNYAEGYDRHTGMVLGDCALPPEIWDGPDSGVPCKGFFPLLASDGLLEQLWEEDEAEFWGDQEDEE